MLRGSVCLKSLTFVLCISLTRNLRPSLQINDPNTVHDLSLEIKIYGPCLMARTKTKTVFCAANDIRSGLRASKCASNDDSARTTLNLLGRIMASSGTRLPLGLAVLSASVVTCELSPESFICTSDCVVSYITPANAVVLSGSQGGSKYICRPTNKDLERCRNPVHGPFYENHGLQLHFQQM